MYSAGFVAKPLLGQFSRFQGGWGLLAHWSVRSLMFQAAQQEGLSPLRLGFTGTLRVLRRAVGQFQQIEPAEIPIFLAG
jgi:hypothetical protein